MSWPAIFAGAVVGTATIFFLVTLGSGVGLSLVPATGVASKGFLTLGAIYFLAAQAFGFAAGGHLVGRLIGPMAETDREEEFRAAAHGLTVWGLCVTATALLVLISGWVAAGSTAISGGLAMSGGNSNTSPAPAVTAYWTDVLFRPAPAPMHASLAWRRFAQANTSGTDATPSTDDESQSGTNGGTSTTQMTPVTGTNGANIKGGVETAPPQSTTTEVHGAPSAQPHVITVPSTATNETPGGAMMSTAPAVATASGQAGNLAADKAEVGRILEVGMANGGTLSAYDRDRTATLVAQDTGATATEAARRVDNAEARIRSDQMKTAEAARKVARNASLWTAIALLFGAVVAAMAAISARWEDDRITFGLPKRAEPV
jgi:hypothetical protein